MFLFAFAALGTQAATVAMVDGTGYETLEAAIAAAEPVDGVVTYEICGKAEVSATGWIQVLKSRLSNVKKVAFVGTTEDAEICIAGGLAILADQQYDIDVSFRNLKLSKPNPEYGGDYGHSTKYFTTWLRNTGAAENTVTYENCTFPNGACNNQYGKTVYTNCTFANGTTGLYNLWIYGGSVEMDGGVFTGTRGMKVYTEGTPATAPSVEVKGTAFSGLTEKAAIVVSKAATVKFAEVSVADCQKGLFQKDIEGSSDDQKVTVTANGSKISGSFAITANRKPETAKTEFNITGGMFTAEVPSDYCADGFTVKATTDADGNTVYGVVEKTELVNYVTLELVFGDNVADEDVVAAKALYAQEKYETCKAANEAYMALFGVTWGKGYLDVTDNTAPLYKYAGRSGSVSEVRFYIHGTLAGFTSLQSSGNQIDCTVGGNHQISRTSYSIIGVDGADGKAKLTDGNVQAYVAGGYASMFTASGKLTIDNIEFTSTTSTTVGASATRATESDTENEVASAEMEIKNCTFRGRLYVYDNFENQGKMTYSIHNCVFDGSNYSGDSNAYAIFAQCKGGNNLVIKDNAIAGFARGINIDHANVHATIEGNTISVTDTGRSCIQLSSLATADIVGNMLELTGGNAITLHEKLLTLGVVPEVSISGNTVTGTGYLIYDDAKANDKEFTSDNLKLTYATDNTVAETVDTTKGVKGSTAYITSTAVNNEVQHYVAQVGTTGYTTLAAAIAALSAENHTLTLLKENAWDAATPVYWAAGTQSGYAATLTEALTAAYKANAGAITIVCRPSADVGTMTHGHVADDLTIYGNKAYLSGGECDLEVDQYKYSRATGAQAADGAYLEKDITITAYELDNLGVWGERHTAHKVTVNLTDCDGKALEGKTNVQRVYISGTTGVNNITLTGCDFLTKATAVYSNADGAITAVNCSFTGGQVPFNINHKADGTQTVAVENCTFTNCGDDGDWKQFAAPLRLVNSGAGTQSAEVTGCAFAGTVGANGDILLGDGRTDQASNDVELKVVNTAANIQAQKPGYYKDGTVDETKMATVVSPAEGTLETSVAKLLPANDGSEAHPYSREQFAAMTRAEYIAAQGRLGGTLYVNVGDYTYEKDGVLGNGVRDDTTGQVPDHSELNAYGENGYLGGKNDGANGHAVVFVGGTITSGVTGYTSIDNIGTSLLLAVPAYTKVTFKETTFKNVLSFDYQLYTSPWSQLGGLTFNGCTFDGIIVGAIASQELAFNGCKFNNYENTTSANNSNPTWIRPAYGNWTKDDNEGQGTGFRSLTKITFADNTVTSTRPVKFERIAQWEMATTVTATNNTFAITPQEGDKDEKKTKNVGLYFGANAKFDLVIDKNKKSGETAALYTAVYSVPNGGTYAGLPAGSTVKNAAGEEVSTEDALAWKTTDKITLKTTEEVASVTNATGVSVNFATLADAIAAAQAGETVTLLADVTVAGQLVAEKALTLDLGGKTVTSTYAIPASLSSGEGRYALLTKAPVTVKNGTFAAGQARALGAYANLTLTDAAVTSELTGGHCCVAFCAAGGTYTVANATIKGDYAIANFAHNATIAITGSALEGSGCGLYHNGSYYGLKLTVSDTTINGAIDQAIGEGKDPSGVYLSGSLDVLANAENQNGAKGRHQATFTRCTIKGNTGVEVKYTDLTLEDCTVVATTEVPSYKPNNNGMTALGFAVVSTDNAKGKTTPKPEGTITITGADGSYTGLVGLGSLDSVKTGFADFEDAHYAVSGGTFSDAVLPEYCAAGFIPTANDDGTYGVKAGAYVAAIGTTGYETLEAALVAAKDGETVKLLADVTESVTIAADRTLTLDLNGKTLSAGKASEALTVTGHLTIDDTSAAKSGRVVGDGRYAVYMNNRTAHVGEAAVGGSLTLNAGSLEGATYGVYILANQAAFTMNGGKVSATQAESIRVNNDYHAKTISLLSGEVGDVFLGSISSTELTTLTVGKADQTAPAAVKVGKIGLQYNRGLFRLELYNGLVGELPEIGPSCTATYTALGMLVNSDANCPSGKVFEKIDYNGETWYRIAALQKIAITFDDSKTVALPFAMDWLKAHVGEGEATWTTAALEEKAENGLAKWQCYLFGLDPNKKDAKVVATAGQGTDKEIPLAVANADASASPLVTDGYVTVAYVLMGSDDRTAWTQVATSGKRDGLAIPLTGTTYKFYRVDVTVTSAEGN